MKEIYDWVPWFTELSRKIAEGGPEFLVDRARRVSWGETTPALLRSEVDPDPLSFVYTIAAYSRTFARRRIIYPSISESFGLPTMEDADSEHVCIFPTPTPRSNLIFHNNNQRHLDALWTLLCEAVEGIDSIRESDFARVLQIRNMGVAKLTQTLFLVNPHAFIPLDNPTRALGSFDLSKESPWTDFRKAMANVLNSFPGCKPSEINMFAFLQSSSQLRLQPSSYFQVSSNVMNDGEDCWKEFNSNNWVYTGGPKSGIVWDKYDQSDVKRGYPIQAPTPGDVVLVRTGRRRGRGIGVVHKNDYRDLGLNAGSKLHVLWLNKTSARLSGDTPIMGFSGAGDATAKTFRGAEAYTPTFRLLDRLSRAGSTADDEKHSNNLSDLSGLTRHAVLGAIAEYDKIRRAAFLKKYGRHGSRSYWIVHDGNRYDMKAIWGAAYVHAGMEQPHRNRRTGKNSIKVKALLESLGFTVEQGNENSVIHAKNRILYGPPGTGKTWSTVNHALAIIDGVALQDISHDDQRFRELQFDAETRNGQIAMVTFHQNFAYEDFIEGIRPRLEAERGRLDYRLHEGIFKRIAHAAQEQPDAPFVLIIDEINRGNIAKVFGELITLIEDSRRIGGDDETYVTLPYSGHIFGVPDNLYVIGTMNTADRSIQLLDTALRRRFEFVEMMPDTDHELIPEDVDGVKCRKMLRAMNECIAALLDREHQIGHTYLFDVNDMAQLSSAFQNKVFPLLQEYFFDDWTKIRAVLGGNGFVQEQNPPKSLQYSDLLDPESRNYDRLPNDDSRWRDPNEYRKIYESAKSDTAE